MSSAPPPGPILEGRSVRLRPPAAEELEQLFDWYNDPEVVAPFDRFEVDTWESFLRGLASAGSDPASTAPRLVIERRSGGRLIGFVGYYAAHPVLTLTDVWYVVADTAERGKGYGSEAVGLLIDHLFRSLALERVGATTDVANAASTRLLERIGLEREGTIRRSLFHHGAWHDVHLYGLTRPEWAARARTG